MSNVAKYVMLMTGLVILFYFGGLIPKDSGGIEISLLNLIITDEGKQTDLQSSQIWNKAIISLTILTVTGIGVIAAGFITRNLRTPLKILFAVYMGNLMWNFYAVYSSVANTNTFMAILLFAPLIIVWIVTVVEWGLQ